MAEGGGGGEDKKWRRITVGPGTRCGHEHFRSLKSARCYDTEPTQNYSNLCYCSIVT